MALQSTNRVAWEYDSQDGNTYRVAAQKAITDQAKLGGRAWAGTAGPMPRGYKMRRITVRNSATASSRVVPVYSVDAPILGRGATITLNHLTDAITYTSDGGPISEVMPRHSVTRQST